MDRLRRLLGKPPGRDQGYERAAEREPLASEDPGVRDRRESTYDQHEEVPFSWLEYGIFALLGMEMLWAWYVVLRDPDCPVPLTRC